MNNLFVFIIYTTQAILGFVLLFHGLYTKDWDRVVLGILLIDVTHIRERVERNE